MRASAGRKLTRRSSQPPASASSVFPVAIAAATGIDAPLVAFASRAPTAIAGQVRGPNSTTAASAMPAGAQTGVITPCATDSSSPSLAATKYSAAMPVRSRRRRSPPIRASARVRMESPPSGAALRFDSATVPAQYRGRARSSRLALAGDHDVHARLADVAAGAMLVAVVHHELEPVGVTGQEAEAVHVPARFGAVALVRQSRRSGVAARAEGPVVL